MNNIVNYAADSSALILGGSTLPATLAVQGAAGLSNSQTFNGLTLNAGVTSAITVANGSGGTATLALGAITRNVGGRIDFSLPASGSITTTSTNNSAGILGPWATVGGSNWAAVSGGAIVAYSAYTDIAAQGAPRLSTARPTCASTRPAPADLSRSAAGTASIGTLLQNTTTAATIATAGQVFRTDGILIPAGQQAVTVGVIRATAR